MDVATHVLPEGLLLTDLLEHGVESVFHLVLCPAGDLFSDGRPLIP